MKRKGILTCLLIVISLMLVSCGKEQYKLNFEPSGGLYMVYKVSKDTFTYEDEYKKAIDQVVAQIRARLSTHWETEVYTKDDQICVEVLAEDDASLIDGIIQKKATLYFISAKDDSGNPNFSDVDGEYKMLKSIDELLADGSVKLSNEDVVSASVGAVSDSSGNTVTILEFGLNSKGTTAFKEMTEAAYNNGRERIAIWFDGDILDAPIVSSVISDGRACITGFDSRETANELANYIYSGPLNYNLKQVKCITFERKKLKK